jgi:hypothetical protein
MKIWKIMENFPANKEVLENLPALMEIFHAQTEICPG